MRPRFVFLGVLTLVFAGLNLLKPLTIDDPAYLYFARQIAAHPLDPYGFHLLWYQEPNRANDILAPPVVPYLWALGLRLFGEHPAACKLLLLPLAFLLVWAFHSLARRFALGIETPLTILMVLSPALWPSFNFMLDVPALALGLTAIDLFLRACDEASFGKAACAGLLAGIGFETKYTACVAVAVFVVAAILHRRWALGLVAVLVALHVIGAWELLMAALYGRSHFFNRLAPGGDAEGNRLLAALTRLVLTKGPLFTSLLSLLGGVTPALLLLGLAARGWRWRLPIIAGLFCGVLLTIGLFDSRFDGVLAPSPHLFGPQVTPPLKFELADVLFAVFGGAMLWLAGLIAWQMLRSSKGDERRDNLFLVVWLVLEIVAYFPLTDFPAVRRILGIVIALTLLLGRYAVQHELATARRSTLYAVVVFSVLLGLGLFTLDFHSAALQREGADQAAAWVREHGGGRVWYTGHWGFQYYAERQGMKAVIPQYDEYDGLPSPTRLEPGDWVVIPDEWVNQQTFRIEPDELLEVTRLTFDDRIPLRSLPSFHGSPVAVQHQEGPRFRVRIYEVQKLFIPLPRPKT